MLIHVDETIVVDEKFYRSHSPLTWRSVSNRYANDIIFKIIKNGLANKFPSAKVTQYKNSDRLGKIRIKFKNEEDEAEFILLLPNLNLKF